AGKVFFGVCAPEEIFAKYKYLLKVSDACNWSGEQKCDLSVSFCTRDYFGEKVALYYLWLGWYTRMLVPAAVIGIVVFLYGLAFFNTSPLIHEVCDSNITMCPRCDIRCSVWNLSDTCTNAKVSQLFDNEGTVAFAMFMAIWATLFLELWKRHRALHVSKWKVFDWCEEEEELILEIVNNPQCKPKEFRHSYLRSIVVLLLVTLVLVVIIGLAHALVICRVLTAILLSQSEWDFFRDHATTIAMLSGAVLHYITIQVMTRVNKTVAFKLCEFEKTRSFAATEKRFTVKMFTFQFFTLFSSLFYVAFFLGRINGYPGNYVRIAGKWRLEEVKLCFRRTKAKKMRRKCGNCYRKACREEEGNFNLCDLCKLRSWLDNYDLNDVNAFSLFNEFLEMVLQFSFTTIFVAAFPLAPLLALINNIFEIRLDAIKMVSLERRLVPKKTNDIGVWTRILEAVGVMAVIANGLVIGISSDFIPRLVYRYHYGPCATSNSTSMDCMTGYINNTLATAFMSNDKVREDFNYKDYRNDEDQSLTSQFWLILALRFAFVILFEHVVVMCKFIAAWFIPDSPIRVKNDRLDDKLRRLKKELQ
uniref:Anoctamin n=1 Tax=Sinocyclocheilus rhinocerous TaxID=307959 RepID=A0A673K7S4_9TELE